MTDLLREALPSYADGLSAPPDLLTRVEAGAGRLRRRRRAGAAAGCGVALLLAAGGVEAVRTPSGSTPTATVGQACTGPQLSTAPPASASTSPTTPPAGAPARAPAPGNVLSWPCRGDEPVTFGAAFGRPGLRLVAGAAVLAAFGPVRLLVSDMSGP